MLIHNILVNVSPSYIMSFVYISQAFAVKHLNRSLEIDEGVANIKNTRLLDSFKREVNSLSSLSHPNIVSLLGYSMSENTANPSDLYLVYELCSNGDLSKILLDDTKAMKVYILFLMFHKCILYQFIIYTLFPLIK
jgi:serine/threonine protein kinase